MIWGCVIGLYLLGTQNTAKSWGGLCPQDAEI